MCKNKVHNIETVEDKKSQEEEDDTLELGLISINRIESSTRFVPLLGRNWLDIVNPHWKELISNQVESKVGSIKEIRTENLEQIKKCIEVIKQKFSKVFSDSGSCIKDFKVDIQLKSDVKPIFHCAYEMPFSLRSKVELELSKLIKAGILSKTLNKVIESDHCVLPLPTDIFACLSGNKYFTVIDLQGAYQQLEISEYSKELFTINTHMGLFRYNRLTYGVSSAPGIFQTIMETILAGLSNTKCYLDDILVYGATLEECHQNVQKVMSRLEKYNVR
ncbi:PREDICTED: uncharacterized protein K02A2.6-like, partial [Trachymyrmex cornetzi]|uniref:uncharacterized protein K02A2.6-like n=1 Tax=Trachymyrmex cornetzi TaxID=471704 RepID=UPI00084F55C7